MTYSKCNYNQCVGRIDCRKVKMTVKEAIKVVVGKNNNNLTIHTLDLKKELYALLEGRKPMDSTITRKMRNLRTEGYEVTCLSKKESLYNIKFID
ncbi:MAG: hypothetical protein EOM11_09675 [Erysipelotrichia bacterium]|nr:hypothetical protein [Erysipelotrichia bacterium]